MTTADRRTFLKTAGVSAAAVGVTAVVGQSTTTVAGSAAPAATARPVALPAAVRGPLVAYIDDVSTGRIAVMVEGREVTVTDHQLVAKLHHALNSSPKV